MGDTQGTHLTTYTSTGLMLRSWYNLVHEVANGNLVRGSLRKHFTSK